MVPHDPRGNVLLGRYRTERNHLRIQHPEIREWFQASFGEKTQQNPRTESCLDRKNRIQETLNVMSEMANLPYNSPEWQTRWESIHDTLEEMAR